MTSRDWLATLPSGWRAQRADAVLDYRKTPTRTAEFQSVDVFHYSIPAIQETGDGVIQNGSEIESDKIALDGGELIVSKLNPRKGCVLLTRRQSLPIVCSTEFVPLVARPGFDARFAFYVYSSTPVRELISAVVQSVTRSHQRANPEDITKIWIPVPPTAEQRAIADYLDLETARLDALVAAKERVLWLLAEKRRALITRAITRGLDPRAPLRDSGIPWLGEIPAHWSLVMLRRVGRVCQGDAFSHSLQGQESGEYPWFKVGDMNLPGNEIEMISADNFVASTVAQAAKATLFDAGAVIFPRVGAALLTNKRRLLIRQSIIDDNTYAVIPGARILSRFLLNYLLLVDMASISSSGLVPTVTFSAVNELTIPVPTLDEQRAIVAHIERETAKLDAVKAATGRTIALLRERRGALIAAAVTGQTDVESAA